MTDVTAGRGGVGIRLFVQGGDVVRRTFDQIGDSGRKMWAEVALGERSANPAIRALSTGVAQARGFVDDLASRAGSGGVALAAFGAAGLAAAAAIGALAISLGQARESMAWAAELTDTSDRIGVNVEALQAWGYAADEAGVDVGQMTGAMERLNGVLGAFKVGIGDARLKPVFEELGITKDQLANVTTADEMLLLLADTLGQISDRAVQVRLAKSLQIEELLPLLRLGSDGLREMLGEAEGLNLVVGRDTVAALDAADRKLEIVGRQLAVLRNEAVVPVAVAFGDLASWVTGFISRMDEAAEKAPAWQRALQSLSPLNNTPWGYAEMYNRARNIGRGGIADDFDPAAVQAGINDLIRPPSPGYEPRGHSRGAGSRSGASNAAAAARQAEREAEQRRERQDRAEDQLIRIGRELTAAWNRSGHMQTIGARAGNEILRLEEERVERLKEIARAEEEYVRSRGLQGLTKADADLQRLKTEELIAVEQSLVKDRERRELAARRLETDQDAASAAIEMLEIEAQMAETQRERHQIEREILAATIEIARKRKQQEVDADPEYQTEDARAAVMSDFNTRAARQADLLEYKETERLRAKFRSYGKEVVQAIEDGRIGEYIGDKLKERLLEGGLSALFNMLQSASQQEGGGWMKQIFKGAEWLFDGPRASGGDTKAGRFYTTVEHGRPELFVMSGQGYVHSTAETARMLREEVGVRPDSDASAGVTVHMPAINIYAPGADSAALSKVETELRALRDEMPNIAIRSVADARSRRIM